MMNNKAIDIPIYGGYDRKPSATGGGTDNPHKYYVITREDIRDSAELVERIKTLVQALQNYGGTVMISVLVLTQHDSENYVVRSIRGGGGTNILNQIEPENIYYLALEDCCQYILMSTDTPSFGSMAFEGNSFIDMLNAYGEDVPQSQYDEVVALLQEHEVTEEQYNMTLDKIKNDTIS